MGGRAWRWEGGAEEPETEEPRDQETQGLPLWRQAGGKRQCPWGSWDAGWGHSWPRSIGAFTLYPGMLASCPPEQCLAQAPQHQSDKRISTRKVRKGKRLQRLPLFCSENPTWELMRKASRCFLKMEVPWELSEEWKCLGQGLPPWPPAPRNICADVLIKTDSFIRREGLIKIGPDWRWPRLQCSSCLGASGRKIRNDSCGGQNSGRKSPEKKEKLPYQTPHLEGNCLQWR